MSRIPSTPDSAAERPRSRYSAPLSFVRRSSRMTASQLEAWQTLSDTYLIDVPRGDGVTSVAEGACIDTEAEFGRQAPLIVEIGSGQGHALVHAAAADPESDFIGIEVYRAGLARTMLNANQEDARNLRLIEANAPEVLDGFLPAGSVSEIRVFFPDPWHKAKHNKRRLVSEQFAATMSRALAPGGLVRLATDWEEYALVMREVLDASPALERAFEGGWAERFDGRPLTAFEKKGIRAGRTIFDLTYRLS